MKKFFAFGAVLILVLTLTACGGGSGEGSTVDDDKRAMASLIDWMKNDKFSYDFTMTSEGDGVTSEMTGSMAKDGENMAITTEMTAEGQTIKSRVIMKDNMTYIVDDVNKFIMKTPVSDTQATGGMMTDYTNIAKVGSGTGEIDGRTLPYEEYEAEGASVKYYMDGEQVYGFVSEFEGYKTTAIIKNPSNSVPAGVFELPEGYTEM